VDNQGMVSVPSSSTPTFTPSTPSTWHIFCKVVDNFGDIGVCWRLACQLATRGKTVRLWVDDVSALAWMAPEGYPNVTVMDCAQGIPQAPNGSAWWNWDDIFVDTFGCDFAIDLIALQAINTPATGKKSIYFSKKTEKDLIAELQAHVKSLLAPYEYPKEIEFIDALPMTTTGKVQRRVLRLQEEERAKSLKNL